MTSQIQAHKPSSIEVIKILDDALPKIKVFQSLSYTQANRILNDEYFIDQWKKRKRNFGSLFLNLDDKHQVKMLGCLEIELSEPKKKFKDIEEPIEALFQASARGENPFDYKPLEQAIIHKFTLYALNHSSYKGFTQNFIDVKGWIKAWKMMSKTMKIEFSNMLIDYA